VEPWWYTVRYFRGALPDRVTTAFLFLVFLWAQIASSVIMTLLTNSENVPLVLSVMHFCNLVERPIMKQSFLSSVSTWSARILHQVVELLGVVVHGHSSLLEVHELLTLLPYHAWGDVVGAKGITELNLRYLIVCGASGGIVDPPHTSVTT
jgi:hypothetical protein